MTRLHATPRYLPMLALPLLAATLACSALGGVGGAPNAAFTQAAATLGAAATLVATAQVGLATSVAATSAPLATAAATAAAATPAVTAAPTGGNTLTPLPSGAVVDPCSLLTVDEASALTGVPAAKPTGSYQTCLYYNPAVTKIGVALIVVPASQAQVFLAQYVLTLKATGITLDQTVADQLTKDSSAGDMPAATGDLQTLITGTPGYDVKKVDGLGSAAFRTVDQNHGIALFAAQPGALVILIMRGTASTDQAVALPAMITIVKRILATLPETFTLASTP